MVAKSRADYWDALDAAIDQDREAHGKKPLPDKQREPVSKETKVSRTDPDAGYMVRDGKPKGFFYLDHRTVDGRLGIITDTYATPANVHDSIVYLGQARSPATNASTSTSARSGWMPATRRSGSLRGWNSAAFSA